MIPPINTKGAFTLRTVRRRAARHQTAKSKRDRLEQQNRRRTVPYGALLLSLCTFTSIMIQRRTAPCCAVRRRAAPCGAVRRRAAPMERRQQLLCCAVRRAVWMPLKNKNNRSWSHWNIRKLQQVKYCCLLVERAEFAPHVMVSVQRKGAVALRRPIRRKAQDQHQLLR